MDIQKYMDFEQKRAQGYQLLAALFYEPQRDLIESEQVFERLCETASEVCAEHMDSFKNLQKLFAKYSNQELLVDYSALFVGPTELIAAPYGSVYLDGERQLMGDSTMEVIKMYREHGLVIDKDYMNAPDHITAELEFMYYLLHNKVQLLGEGKLEQASLLYQSELKFYGNFLKPWIKPFTENIRKGINNEYYVALAEALQCFVETGVWKDMVPFEELVNPV